MTSRLAVAALVASVVPYVALLTDIAVFVLVVQGSENAPPPSPDDGADPEAVAIITLIGVALAAGPTAIVLGVAALWAIRRHRLRGRGMAIAGLVTGSVGSLITVGVILLLSTVFILAFG